MAAISPGRVILVQVENALQYPAMTRHVVRVLLRLGVLTALVAAGPAIFAQGFGGTVADHLVRGDSLLAQKKGTEAIVQFQEARTLCATPDEIVSSLEGEARAHMLQEETLPAVGLLEEAATRFPDDPRASNLLFLGGSLSQSAHEFDKAIDLYRRALARNPTPDILPPLKLQLALALRMVGRPGEAIEVLKDFEKDFPDNSLVSTAMYQMAIATHDLGTGNKDRAKLEEAVAIYKRLIEKFPGRPATIEAHFEMGLVLTELGRRKEGADYFTQYVSMNPTSAEAPAALEKAADLLLLRSPKQSAQLYALAQIKAKSNPKPTSPEWALSRWLTAKQTLADTLSRGWVLAILGLLVLGAVALVGRLVVKRMRKDPAPTGA
jgi:tetratricopeptide (TPR) repeat protein